MLLTGVDLTFASPAQGQMQLMQLDFTGVGSVAADAPRHLP